MAKVHTVLVELVQRPARRVIVKRGVSADDYFSYCVEVGCSIWDVLTGMPSLSGEPLCLWLPPAYVMPNTSVYVQGVDVPDDYAAPIPDGFDIISLPAASYFSFQGEPFKEENFGRAIKAVRKAMKAFNPGRHGYAWDDEQPRIQLEPRGERGYIEMRAVRPLPERIP